MPKRSPALKKRSNTSNHTAKRKSRHVGGQREAPIGRAAPAPRCRTQAKMANNRRVVVTGIGLVSSLGIGTEANWAALTSGCSGVGPITKFDASQFSTRIAGEVRGFNPLQFIEKKDVKKMDVFIQYAIAATQFAMNDSGFEVTPANAPDVGVYIASGIGGFTTIEREHKALLEGGPRKISPF